MPYITTEARSRVAQTGPDDAGELNFCFTTVLADYWERKGQSYATINDIIGALEGAKLEFYRRVVAPYEMRKLQVNGDVYNTVSHKLPNKT